MAVESDWWWWWLSCCWGVLWSLGCASLMLALLYLLYFTPHRMTPNPTQTPLDHRSEAEQEEQEERRHPDA